MKGFLFLLLAVCVGIYYWPDNLGDVHAMLAASYRVDDIKDGWRVCDPTRKATRAVVCVHGLFGNRGELASFVPVILKHCPECAVYLIDWGWFATGLVLPPTETPVTLIGMSHGAARAIEYAYTKPNRVSGVVALAPYASFQDVVVDKIMRKAPTESRDYVEAFVGFALNVTYTPPRPLEHILRKDARLLLVHGANDALVPIKHTHQLVERATGNGVKVTACSVDPAWHVPSQLLNDPLCREKILKIIK